VSEAPQIHETAIIEEGAVIGAGTRVWHHAHLRSGSVVGDHCVIGKNVFVDTAVRIGNGTHVQNNVSVYRGVELADAVFVGPSVVFTNDRYPRAGASDWQLVSTSVGSGSSIGAGAVVICGITIAPWSVVGAGSVVVRGTEDHEVVAGNPATTLGWACRCGRVVVHGPTRPPIALDTCDDCAPTTRRR
jgi:acetyltransferase-like isoleucine patch superfamily enzyme